MNRPLLLSVLLGLASSALAAERVALVIGNDAYEHAEKLNTAVGDATAVAQSLSKLGFDVIPAMNTGVETLLESFEKLSARAQGAKAVVVYFAGHGIEAGGVNYLIPVDAKLDREVQLRTQTVSMDTVLDELKQMNVPARMVILDCCRNNPLQGRAWRATRASGGGLAALAQDTLAEATLVVFSASPGKPALDRVGDTDTHSPFASALLNQLPRPGVHSFEMFGHVEDDVIQKTEGRQSPRLFYNGSTQPFRTFRFGPTDSTAPPATASAPPSPAVTMPVQQNPPAPASPAVELPKSGFFDLGKVFQTGPYAAYNSHSRSQILKKAQEKLKTAGLYDSTADGAMGRGSQRAILLWQQQHGVEATGRLDQDTLASLGLQDIRESPPPPEPPPAKRTASSPSRVTSAPQPAHNFGVPGVPTAARVPGKRGFVRSPYTQGVIDVQGMASGTKVRCPESGKLFYVP